MNNLIMFISVMSGGLLSRTSLKLWHFLIILLTIKFLWICFT
jgi:hypothetical protein